MQSQVAMPKPHLLPAQEIPLDRPAGLFNLERATSAIVWLSYCGLVSAALIVMGW